LISHGSDRGKERKRKETETETKIQFKKRIAKKEDFGNKALFPVWGRRGVTDDCEGLRRDARFDGT
jgi:hypothetical protein